MKSLNEVTLFAIDGLGGIETHRNNWVLNWCMQHFKFHSVIHATCSENYDPPCGVDAIKINRLTHSEYSTFCVHRLPDIIKSDYCMIINSDGFIINPHLWEDSFLNYDYIGAPWYHLEGMFRHHGWTGTLNQVGNGGFCIRSKKFLEFSKSLSNYNGTVNEDLYLCTVMYEEALRRGIRYADVDTASRFSVENPSPKYPDIRNSFGFHAKGNLPLALEIVNKHIHKLLVPA